MPDLNALDVDDAIMQGEAQADAILKEVEDNYAQPAKEAQYAALWAQVVGQLLPGIPFTMAEEQLRKADQTAYDNAKKRFMEGMQNGAANRQSG